MMMTINIKKRLLVYLLMLLFLTIAYLPLSCFLFSLKNDALTANFPNKYFFSAALHAGYFPIWNPYINFGLPLYADPGFAFWNPITWAFGTIGYSIPILSIETLSYIWIGGTAAFELGIWLGHRVTVSFCMGLMFMCCGFFIGNLQHTNFLTGAAFLPFVIRTYLDLHKDFTVRKLFFCLISLYLLSTSGHPAIPIACIYFLLLIRVGLFYFYSPECGKQTTGLRSLKIDLVLIICFMVLTFPLLYSYYEIYPYYTRSVPVTQANYSDTGFDLSSYISFIFPFSSTGNSHWFKNDPLMRNGYFSLVGFLCFLAAILKKKNSYQKLFLFSGAFMLLLSLGGHFKQIIFTVIPLLDHIRTNGEFRVFSILSFVITGSYILSGLFDDKHTAIFRSLLFTLAMASMLIILARFTIWPKSTLFVNGSEDVPVSFFLYIKRRLDALTFIDRLFINAIICIFLVGFYFLFNRKIKNSILLPLFIMIDLILFCWANLPVTGVQLLSPFYIQHFYDSVPSCIPIPKLLPISENVPNNKKMKEIIGSWSYYSKQPGTPFLCDYPSRLNNTVAYFNSSLPDSINKKPFIFILGQNQHYNISLTSFTPGEVVVRVAAQKMDSLILLQNNYFRWTARVNGIATRIDPYAIAFMKVPVGKGVSVIKFNFDDRIIKNMTAFSILAWVAFAIFVFYKKGTTSKLQRIEF